MNIDIINQHGVPIELKPVEGADVNVKQSAPVPVVVKKKHIDIEPQQQPNVALDIVNKVAFGSGVIIVKTEAAYLEMWDANTLDPKKWYVLYDEKGNLLKIWLGRKLFARKGDEEERKTNVFPLVFPVVF